MNTLNNNSENLRTLADKKGLFIGAAVDIELLQTSEEYRNLLAQEFNMVTPENTMKWWALQPEKGVYTFKDADEIVVFAMDNNMAIRGHTLIWDKKLPKWLTEANLSRDEVEGFIKNHIQTVVSHFKGQLYALDVVNEALTSAGLEEAFLFNIMGPKYLHQVFQWAHEADPEVKLFYNEWGADMPNEKFEAMYKILEVMVSEGVPIHGVGLQMHIGLGSAKLAEDIPPAGGVKAAIERLGKLGLEVHITEMDVQIQAGVGSTTERLEAQAEVYKNVLQEALSCPNFKALVQWGVDDKHSWIHEFTGEHDAPLLFDEDNKPKPAYFAIKQLLQ